MKIPYHRSIVGEEEIVEISHSLRSGWLTTGPKVIEFEEKMSLFRNSLSCLGLNSCTSGLFLALKVLGIKEGDEVITTSFSFPATAGVIVHCGARPVFADINLSTLNLDPESVREKITSKTKAIIVVHIGGNPAEMNELMELAKEHDLKVIEDCAHAIEGDYQGVPLGGIGDAGVYSFYATKNITTGEGGMVVTKDAELMESFRLWSRHGLSTSTLERDSRETYKQYDIIVPGYKFNMTDLQAALGIHQLNHISKWYHRRAEIKKMYDDGFSNFKNVHKIIQNPKGKSALHLYILRIDSSSDPLIRDKIIGDIQGKGIQLSINYHPIHLFSWYKKNVSVEKNSLFNTEIAGEGVFSLPFFPALTNLEVTYIIETISEIFTKYGL